jgi:hypothetical protein
MVKAFIRAPTEIEIGAVTARPSRITDALAY